MNIRNNWTKTKGILEQLDKVHQNIIPYWLNGKTIHLIRRNILITYVELYSDLQNTKVKCPVSSMRQRQYGQS